MSLETAEQFEEQEQYIQAYAEYQRLLSKNTKDVDLLQRTANCALILNKKNEAEEYLKKIIQIEPENTMCYEQLMDIYNDTDKYKYYINRGNLHIVQGQISHAINDFNKALNKAVEEKEIIATRFILGNLYEQSGKINQAIDEFLRITDSDSANKETYLKLAALYEKTDMISAAVNILEKATENGFENDTEIKEALASYYLKNSSPDKAIELTNDDLTKIRSYLESNNEEKAFELLQKLEKDYKKNPTYHSLTAQYYYQKNDYTKALSAVDEFEKFAKNSPLIYQMRALIYDELKDDFKSHINWAKFNILRDNKDVALNEYLQAYDLNKQDADIVATIAELLENLKDNTGANEFYEKLVELEPTNKKALTKLADYYESIGENKLVIEYLEQLHKADNNNANVLKRLGKLYEKTRKKDKALEYYKQYISISSAVSDYDEISAKIIKLEAQPKSYTESDGGDGLIDIIMKWFNKK